MLTEEKRHEEIKKKTILFYFFVYVPSGAAHRQLYSIKNNYIYYTIIHNSEKLPVTMYFSLNFLYNIN